MNIDDIGHTHFSWFGRKILLKGTIRSLLSVLSSRLCCLCKEMQSLKYGLCLMYSPAVSNRQRHSFCCSQTGERAERGSKHGGREDFEILQLMQGKEARKGLELLFFFFFLVKKARLLPQKRKTDHLWLLQACPKKSAMKQ